MPQDAHSDNGADSHPGPGGKTRFRRPDPARILIILPNWVGDLVLATPALRSIRARFAGIHLTGLVKGPMAEVLAGGDWFDEVIHWPGGQTRDTRRQSFLGLAGELRDRKFDWALLMSNSFRAALFARLAGIPRRIGYDRDGRGMLLTDKLLPHKFDGKFVPVSMIRYYNAIARYLGCRDCPMVPELFATPEQEQVATDALEAAGVQAGQPVVVLNPGAAYGPAKCWVPERFAEVADRLVEQTNAAVLIACGPKEIDVARKVAGHMRQRPTVLDNPVMRLGPLKALIRRSSLLITNDTGPRHFANAFGTPVVTVFGPTDREWTATEVAGEKELYVPVDCGPCMKRQCPLDHRCMTRISSDMVLTAATELLKGRAAAAVT